MDERLGGYKPKAVLHDHLDGGLRVATVLELADEIGHQLPADNHGDLSDWFHQGQSGSLERYLEAFDHTIAVMQTANAIERVAIEAVEDLSADDVIYAELRFDPGLFTKEGLRREEVVEAALSGLATASRDRDIVVYGIVCALRHQNDSEHAADAAIRFHGDGVVAFDLAGPEAGYPPDQHLAAIRKIQAAGLGLTLHAGEGDGPHSVWRALALCGAQRIGHGVHLADETDFGEGGSITRLGSLAERVRDQQVPLEVAITSNLHTGGFEDAPSHPFGEMFRTGFNVSINTDNRLMSDVSVASEYALAIDAFDLTDGDIGLITENAVRAGFGPWPERKRIIEEVVRPAYGLPA
ncbi:MAG: adenosine deaminase [Acidimicrobiia bacterium]